MERQKITKDQKPPARNHQVYRNAVDSHDSRLLGFQRSVGNHAIQRLINSQYVQAKLQVSEPEDPHEIEADQVAETISRVPLAVREDGEDEEKVQRACDECEEEKRARSTESGAVPQSGTSAATAQSIRGMNGGAPLPAATRTFFEPRFGTDFGNVRVHTDSRAAETAQSINAKAFTFGHNIGFGSGQYAPDSEQGRHLLAHELTHVVQQNGSGTSPVSNTVSRDTTTELSLVTPKKSVPPKVEFLLAASYPHLLNVLSTKDLALLQQHINVQAHNERIHEKVNEFEKKEHERAVRQGRESSYKFESSYSDRLSQVESQYKEYPQQEEIQVDTAKLIDPAILDEQPWNIEAQKKFREHWVAELASKPTIINLSGDHTIKQVFYGLFWGEKGSLIYLPTEGGLITFKKLLEIPQARSEYNTDVLKSPLVQAVLNTQAEVEALFNEAQSIYQSEVERRDEFPHVSAVAEFFGSSIDWAAAAQLLPPGKFAAMDLWEKMDFISKLNAKQLDLVVRELPTSADWAKVKRHFNFYSKAVREGMYEATVVVTPIMADEIERILRKTYGYRNRTLEGAGTVVTVLQAVRTGANIALTVMGGMAGKAYGLLGVSAGSAAGAGTGTLTQETAIQIAEGRFDPGSLLMKAGKDAAVTFIGSLIGGALASKFQAIFNARLAVQIPNEALRMFAANRVADVVSGVVTSPIEIVLDGMLEGEWPTSMDDFLGRVADNTIKQVAIGSAMDVAGHAFGKRGGPKEGATPDVPPGAPEGVAGEPVKAPATVEAPTKVEGEAAAGQDVLIEGPAKQPGHDVRIERSGEVDVCSDPCVNIALVYREILADNPEFRRRFEGIRKRAILADSMIAGGDPELVRQGNRLAKEAHLDAVELQGDLKKAEEKYIRGEDYISEEDLDQLSKTKPGQAPPGAVKPGKKAKASARPNLGTFVHSKIYTKFCLWLETAPGRQFLASRGLTIADLAIKDMPTGNISREFQIEHPYTKGKPRVDVVNWDTAEVHEIKPAGSEEQGFVESQGYAREMNLYMKRPDGMPWKAGRTLTYDADKILDLFIDFGYFE